MPAEPNTFETEGQLLAEDVVDKYEDVKDLHADLGERLEDGVLAFVPAAGTGAEAELLDAFAARMRRWLKDELEVYRAIEAGEY